MTLNKVQTTLQKNNGLSQTGIETIKAAGQLFRVIAERELVSVADKLGFSKTDFEENKLPNGQSFKTYTFEKTTKRH